MTEIDKKNLKNYLYCTFGITYIAWVLLAIFTQSHILGLETIIGRTLYSIIFKKQPRPLSADS